MREKNLNVIITIYSLTLFSHANYGGDVSKKMQLREPVQPPHLHNVLGCWKAGLRLPAEIDKELPSGV